MNRKKSFDEYNREVQLLLNLSLEFRHMVALAIKIGLNEEGLAQVAATLVTMGYARGESVLETAQGIKNGLNGALEIYMSVAAGNTIH